MTTPSRRAFVSVAATVVTLALGACASAPSRAEPDRLTPTAIRHVTIRFDNAAPERVHVYLIGVRHAWWIGRVEPGAVVSLPVPDAALTEGSTMVRLVALTGERATLEAARRASMLTASQPASAIVSQRWRYLRGELASRQR